jgi:hypothetical protein
MTRQAQRGSGSVRLFHCTSRPLTSCHRPSHRRATNPGRFATTPDDPSHPRHDATIPNRSFVEDITLTDDVVQLVVPRLTSGVVCRMGKPPQRRRRCRTITAATFAEIAANRPIDRLRVSTRPATSRRLGTPRPCPSTSPYFVRCSYSLTNEIGSRPCDSGRERSRGAA